MCTLKVTAYDGLGEPRKKRVRFADGSLFLQGRREPIALANLHLELGGHKEVSLRMTDPQSGLVLTTDNPRVLDEIAKKSEGTAIASVARTLRADMPNNPLRNLKLKLSLAATLACFVGAGWLAVNCISDVAAEKITPDLEEQLGAGMVDSKFETKSADAKRVARIGERLVQTLDKPVPYHFKFYVQPSKDINAYCLPGGSIVVLKGMVDSVKSDDELAGVIGHEIGHALHRDVVKRTAHELGTDITLGLLFGGQGRTVKAIVDGAKGLEHAKFSRDEESAADSTGVGLAYKADYKPDAAADLFERLQSNGQLTTAFEFASDHPSADTRIAAIKSEAARLIAHPKKSIAPVHTAHKRPHKRRLASSAQ
jgi:predicted Zn-dependent protease